VDFNGLEVELRLHGTGCPGTDREKFYAKMPENQLGRLKNLDIFTAFKYQELNEHGKKEFIR
jgi:hypothetical protein